MTVTNETQVEVTQACPNVLCNCDGYDIVFSPWAKAWHCKCLSCKAEGPVRPSRAEAITAWNTRIQAEKRNNALADELRALDAKATAGPWCWEQCGDKCDDTVIGIAWWADDETCTSIAGKVDSNHPGNIERELYREAIAYEMPSPSEGGTGSTNAALIVALRNNLPAILAALEADE